MQKMHRLVLKEKMELKWLEDLVCVVEKGHFARAAEERFITQSALSRRIQSLESWAGASLLDRSQHPIQLSSAGLEFIKFAREIIGRSYESRAVVSEFSRLKTSGITIACLHTLALNYVPNFVHRMQNKLGHFATSIVAETRTIEEYLSGLSNGNSDFFICYGHDSLPLEVDPNEFPRIAIDKHWVRPYLSIDHEMIDLFKGTEEIPYVEYSPFTYMSRVVEQKLKNAPFKKRLKTVYRASLAESLMTATQKGLGLSWLPETVVGPDLQNKGLKIIPNEWSTQLEIRVYRSTKNTNPIVNDIWRELHGYSL